MNIPASVEISVVPFRPLRSFEWAVLSVLVEFGPTPPSLLDATEQLHLHDPAFLKSGLESMREAGAIVGRPGVPCPDDLSESQLTDRGREILQQRGWETGGVEHQPHELVLDWPSGTPVAPDVARKATVRRIPGVTAQQIEDRLSKEELESWLNADPALVWRVKSFYVTGE